MAGEILNRDRLPGNVCFGCGHDNPHGLHIDIRRDERDPGRLVGTFPTREYLSGFPGVTHGGIIYTALDCIAAWVPTVLRHGTAAIWILRSATMKYHRPVTPGETLALSAHISEEGGAWDPAFIATEARNAADELVAEGTFKMVPLTPERFKEVAEVDDIPANWKGFLGIP